MTERIISINGLAVALQALLPKDRTRVTVAELMAATGEDRRAVTDVMHHAHVDGRVGRDVDTDSYFAIAQGNYLSTERKST